MSNFSIYEALGKGMAQRKRLEIAFPERLKERVTMFVERCGLVLHTDFYKLANTFIFKKGSDTGSDIRRGTTAFNIQTGTLFRVKGRHY